MVNIYEILLRAASLKEETTLNSISPERAGGIMYDTLLALNDLWLQQGAALVISKIYASVAAMEADTAPVSDLTGQALRPGQIVVIASSDSDNGSVYRYNGTDAPSWSLVGAIGSIPPVDSLDSDSTSLPLAAHQGKVLDGKIGQLGQEDEKIVQGLKKTYNLFYGNWINGRIDDSDGSIIKENTGRNNIVNINPIYVNGSTTYKYMADSVVEYSNLYISEYDASDAFIQQTNIGITAQSHIFTTNANTRIIRFSAYIDNGTVAGMIPVNMRFYEGGNDKPYVPYYSVDWHALDYEHLTQVYATNESVGVGADGAEQLMSPEYDNIRQSIKFQLESILNTFGVSNNHWVGIWENADLPNGAWVPKNTGVENAANRTFFPVNGGSDYVIGQNPNKKSVLSSTIYIEEYDTSKTFVKETNLGASHQWHTFTTQFSTRYVRFVLYLSGGAFSDIITDEMIFCDGQELIDYITHFVVGVDNIEKNTLLLLLKRDSIFSQTKNIVPDTLVFHNARIDGNGVYHELSTGISNAASEEYIEVEEARTYILSSSNNMSFTLYVEQYDASKNYLDESSYPVVNSNKVLFTVSSSTKYIRIQTYLQDAVWSQIYPQNLQIELGGINTAYTKHNGLSTEYIDDRALYDKMVDSGLVDPKYHIPYYYFWNNYLNDKIDRINELLSGCAGNGTAFFFITDIHWPENAKKSPSLIQYIQEKTHINLLINGGDDGNNGDEELPTILRKVSNRLTIHMVSGNHDLFYPSTGNEIAYQYDMFRTDQVGDTERRYYYFDDIQRKTRYIVLSAYKEGTSTTPVLEGYEDAQYNWFINTALQVPHGWKIIVFSHSFYEIAEQDLTDYYYTDGAQRFIDAIDSYNGDGEIIFAIQGHVHSDRIITTSSDKNVIITTCDKYHKWNEYDIPIVTREPGTRTEQAFDVVVVNYKTRTATFVRIGARALNGINANVGSEVEERVIQF